MAGKSKTGWIYATPMVLPFDGLANCEDDDEILRSRRASTATDMSSCTNEEYSSDDDPYSEDALDSLDYQTIQFFDRYLAMAGRKSRPSKKYKDKETCFKQTKQSTNKKRGSGSCRNCRDHTHQPDVAVDSDCLSTDSGNADNQAPKVTDGGRRKLSVTQLRAAERDEKFEIRAAVLESPEVGSSSAPLQTSVKIGTTNHFRSLNSKPVIPKELQESSGAVTPHKLPQECCRDRLEFYMIFSLLVRMGNSEPKHKDEHSFTRQRSHEDQIWQNKLNDLVWLELRAWHNGRNIQMEDQILCVERERIQTVLNDIMHFKFEPSSSEQCTNESFNCCSNLTSSSVDDCNEALPSNQCSDHCAAKVSDALSVLQKATDGQTSKPKLGIVIPKPEVDRMSVGVSSNQSASAYWNPGYSCCGFCSIFCQTCLANQNDALRQVNGLLEQLDSVESLYPSSRAMKKDWELYTKPEFDDRVRALCLYYNLVTDLRQKILTLGKMFDSLCGKNLPWPVFNFESECTQQEQDETSSECEEKQSMDNTVCDVTSIESLISPPAEVCRERRLSKSVRFQGSIPEFSTDVNSEPATDSVSSGYSSISSVQNMGQVAFEEMTKKCPDSSTPCQSAVSTPVIGKSPNFGGTVYNRSMSELSEGSFMSPYRRYVDKLLKQKGLRKLLQRLTELVRNTLQRAMCALRRCQCTPVVTSPDLPHLTEDSPALNFGAPVNENSVQEIDEWCKELSSYGVWSEHYRSMGLPSFRSLYLFLLKIPLEVMHECLKLRLEQQPEVPSTLSIRQLMRECKEAIKAAVIIRQKYVRMNRVVLLKSELDKVEQDLLEFDDNVKKMLQSYLRYLQSWVQMLLKSTQQTQKNVLEEEWTFVKIFSRYVQRGEALASEMFCSMASNMLDSTGDFLETQLDSCTSVHDNRMLYDITNKDHEFSTTTRHNVLQSCRDFKDVFQETRKRALKAVAFAKMLRKDLEIAAEFEIVTSAEELLHKLQETKHIRLIAPHSSNFVVFIPEHIQNNRPYLWQLLSMTYGHEHSAAPDNVKSEGYLIIWCCDDCQFLPDCWKGPSLVIEPTAEITITLSHLKVEGLLLVVNHSSQLIMQRKVFQKALGATVAVTKEFTSCNQSIADSLMDLKKEAVFLREKIKDAICLVEERLDMDSVSDLDEIEKLNLQARCREILHQCYKFGFEYHKEMTRLVTGEAHCNLGQGLISFAKQWMNFVTKRCERGRGVRPRWANKGLDFLMTACEPQYLKHLTEEEFLSLKQTMNECITHLIGSVDTRSPSVASRSHSPTPHSRSSSLRHSSSYGGESLNRYPRSVSTISSRSDPVMNNFLHPGSAEDIPHADDHSFSDDTQKVRNDEELDDSTTISESESPMERINIAILHIELSREEKLRQINMIGRVISTSTETSVQISARRVTFHWQRGIKIGQGRFGKVYTAVNTDTGDLMALKEIRLQPNDHKTIKEVADELKIFEGIRHQYLVRYFGVEIHSDEMFIFMEYCDCGTLENTAQQGLPEPQIRKYTRQLLEATNVLHENGIVHRDIKGANIFLTSDGNLKLGDFGCCIKLKNHSTMPGEVNTFVGTQAYMAPEVFTKSVNEGHGRAADVWSIGCVVVEMATGNRPWPELESSYQIMFKVGTGETPDIPENLSDEGVDFLSHCFKFDPRERWTVVMLLDHPFTKVDSDEEFASMTFLPDMRLY